MRRAFRLKLRILSGVLFVFTLLLVTRLYFVQVVHGSDYALRAERQYVSSSQQLYDRGSIYFTRKDGTYLSAATLATGFTLAVDAKRIEDPEAAYAALAAIVPIEYEAFMAAVAKTDDPYEVIARRVPDAAGRQIGELEIPGVIVERERWRTYPAGSMAAQTIGFVAYDNDNTLAGRFGLERYYNDVLDHKADGLFGNFFAELFANLDSVMVDARSARQGDLITSIEPMVQEKLNQVLEDAHARYGARETAAIIMDPKTGEIIAMDSIPGFNPNDFSKADPTTFNNPLVEHVYEFGSIVKTLTVAAGLDAGVIRPETTYNDVGCITVNTRTICNYDLKARGVVPMQEVLSQSLNLGVSFITDRLGHDAFRTYFKDLGIGTETGIDLPDETRGIINNLESPRDVEYFNASFGQGIAVTPVGMVRALSSLANDGKIVTPHLVKAVRLESGVTKNLTWGESERVFSEKAAEETTQILVNVVDDALAGGTKSIPEMSVAAKTGTAQIPSPTGGYYDDRYLHSFFGYFPAYEPRFVILLYIREPGGVQYASETLTEPFFELTHFLINYYDIPPDRASYETTR
ncbi:MAG TPA: penicillin-binding protein 2 [Candidatus Paceibacterota bacterium]|nr:penicillin-binding protein 2 [Candidatus Paceibacterota bacterium]